MFRINADTMHVQFTIDDRDLAMALLDADGFALATGGVGLNEPHQHRGGWWEQRIVYVTERRDRDRRNKRACAERSKSMRGLTDEEAELLANFDDCDGPCCEVRKWSSFECHRAMRLLAKVSARVDTYADNSARQKAACRLAILDLHDAIGSIYQEIARLEAFVPVAKGRPVTKAQLAASVKASTLRRAAIVAGRKAPQ